jgi:hypothetical protein
VFGAGTCSFSRQYFAYRVDVFSKQDYIFIVYYIDFVGTKVAGFTFTVIIHNKQI